MDSVLFKGPTDRMQHQRGEPQCEGESLQNIEHFLLLDDEEGVPTTLVYLTGDEGVSSAGATDPPGVIAAGNRCSDMDTCGRGDEDVNHYFKAAAIAFFGSLPLNTPGQGVIREVRFIFEALGFNFLGTRSWTARLGRRAEKKSKRTAVTFL